MKINNMQIISVALIILFVGCLFDMPYGYFQIVRVVGMVAFIALAYYERKDKDILFWIWVASAILINPIIKVPLGRSIWNLVDIIWCVILFDSIMVGYEKKPKE